MNKGDLVAVDAIGVRDKLGLIDDVADTYTGTLYQIIGESGHKFTIQNSHCLHLIEDKTIGKQYQLESNKEMLRGVVTVMDIDRDSMKYRYCVKTEKGGYTAWVRWDRLGDVVPTGLLDWFETP